MQTPTLNLNCNGAGCETWEQDTHHWVSIVLLCSEPNAHGHGLNLQRTAPTHGQRHQTLASPGTPSPALNAEMKAALKM